ncbi:DUF2147 domain-containing protein [Rhizobacter sp. OV335]|uniref:DUF2147 domain-containing protein n=1 Tax=Rhizobacter sp. OV335 TaxID=1500264 RepID=UPI0009120435|nr:DUF2147 domain-containing protein [Rhizobacter sp. OV335]SHN24375.1 Uncharacterized conserved protein, DUF2147 family [Rhizobacter sp. OV335]
MKRLLLALAATLTLSSAYAQSTPAGLWKTIDDSTKKERSLVRIVDTDGVISGKLEKLLDPDAKQDAVCDECNDDRKGQPLVGLPIIRGAKKSADTDGLWDGGTILDPANGKTYKLRLKPVEGGKKLEVRGYVGAPLFGRTQTWIRVE